MASSVPRGTALVIGATGLVGGHLTRLLLDGDRYEEVRVLHRRPTGLDHPRLREHVVDFERVEEWAELLQGDVLFSCLGTTLRDAGDKEAQYRVDVTYPLEVARAASANGVATCALVSSVGADSRSRVFYSRMKGELEDRVRELPFQRVLIFRPSVLVGKRERRRLGEELGVKLGNVLARVLPPARRYRPIPGEDVARAMIRAVELPSGERVGIWALDELFEDPGSVS